MVSSPIQRREAGMVDAHEAVGRQLLHQGLELQKVHSFISKKEQG
jgi:hypothetical protein